MASEVFQLHSKETVSIIVPILNEKDNIPTLFSSIIKQKYRPLEVIFVDGGSIDGTLYLLENYKKKFECSDFSVLVLKEENFGAKRSPAHARNLGVQASHGLNLIFLDGDITLKNSSAVLFLKEALAAHAFVGALTNIIIDTKLELKLSSYYSRIHRAGYQRWIFEQITFNENLGFGEDGDFWYRLQRDLGVKLYLLTEEIFDRHLPHTRNEYLSQINWYARSYDEFVNNALSQKEFSFIKEICLTYFGLLCSPFPIFFLFLTYLQELKKGRTLFFIHNFSRRYLFLSKLWLNNKALPFKKNYALSLYYFFKSKMKESIIALDDN